MGESDKPRDHSIPEEAAKWYLFFEERPNATEAQRARFVEWLRRSPIHIEEFLRVGGMRAEISGQPSDGMPHIAELIAAARENVVGFPSPSAKSAKPGKPKTHAFGKRRRAWYAAAGALLVVLALSLHFHGPSEFAPLGFATELGEQRSIALSDGSVVVLNTATRIDVLFTDSERLIRLHSGEAVFEVAADARRPLRVLAGPAEVVAIGTRFNVYRQKQQTVVTVVEGRVAVRNLPGSTGSEHQALVRQGGVEVSQGNQVTVRPNVPVDEPRAADITAATAWRDRRLIFDGAALAYALREINRYNHRKLELGDENLAIQRISGVFAAHKPEAMVTFLQAVGNMRSVESGEGWVIHSAAAQLPGHSGFPARTNDSDM